jgi:integrase
MPTTKITKATVAKLLRTATGADVITWDADLAGFGLRVQGASARWIVQYRAADGATRRLTLGAVAALSLDDARKRAKVELGTVAAGGDPSEAKRTARAAARAAKAAERAAITVGEAVARWQAAPTARRAKTHYQYGVHLTRHVVPALGAVKVKDITAAHVRRVRQGLNPALSNRVASACSAFFSWCETAGLRPDGTNPTRGLGRAKEPRRIIYLTDAQQAAAWAALTDIARDPAAAPAPSTGGNMRVTPGAVAALRLLALTGLRPSEACNLRWVEVDLERRSLHLTDSKVGARTVPLSAGAVALLDDLRATSTGSVVSPDDAITPDVPVKYTRVLSLWTRVRERAELGPQPLYVLRHTVGMGLVSSGAPMPITMAVLGHTTADMSLRYAHATQDAVTAALDKLDASRPSPTGAPPAAPAVVPLATRRTRRA